MSDYEIETVERPYFYGYLNSQLLVNYGYEEWREILVEKYELRLIRLNESLFILSFLLILLERRSKSESDG